MENLTVTNNENFDKKYFPVLYESGEFLGYWPESNKTLREKLKATFSVSLIGFITLSYIVSSVIQIFRGDFMLFASAAGPGLVTSSLLLKLGAIFWKWSGYISILKDFRELASNPLFETKTQKISRWANKALLWMSYFTGVFYSSAPWVLVAFQYFSDMPVKYSLETASWWYWDITELQGFLPAYLLNVMVYVVVPKSLALVDGLMLDISLYGGELFEDISQSLASMSQDLQQRSFLDSEVDEFLDSLIKRHQKAIEFCNNWRDLATEVIMIQFAIGVFEVCLGGFILNISGDFNTRFTYIGFTSSVITQAFFYCWGGQVLIESGLEVAASLYSFPWYDLNNEAKKKVALMMTGAQMPVVLDVPFFEVSYPTFINILKASHGYITLLGTLM